MPGTVGSSSCAIADTYLRDLTRLVPAAAEALGHEDVVRIPDLSDDTFQGRVDLDRRTLASLQALPGPPDTLTAAMTERLASDIALDQTGFTRALIAPLATPVHMIRQVFDELPTDTEQDWQRISEHLVLVPTALRQYLQTLERAADRGHLVAQRQIRVLASQCAIWVADGFYPELVQRYSQASTALTGDLGRRAAAAAEATAGFAESLMQRLYSRAPEQDGVGAEMYQVTSAAFLGSSVDLVELYEWGWAELHRLTEQARTIAQQVVGSTDVTAATAVFDADLTRQVPVGEPLRDWLQERLDRVTDAVDGAHFDLPSRGRNAEARLVTAASGVMYYSPPDPSFRRPGRVWWSVPPGTQTVHTWREVSTLHHEGVPGHHLQHLTTYHLDLHPWQRLLCHVHGYAEGWAHYAEQLAEEIGLLQDPADRLSMVFGQLWRACRIVIDLGLHLDLPIPTGTPFTTAERWTPEAGVDMLVAVAEVDRSTAVFEVDRYLGWPGQALAFKVGARLWQQTRSMMRTAQGDRFDLKQFHADALGLGPMGLGPLQTALQGQHRE